MAQRATSHLWFWYPKSRNLSYVWGDNGPIPQLVAVSTVCPIKKLRTKNWIHSPFLRLPCETLVYILLFVVGVTKRAPAWTATLPSCYCLRETSLSTEARPLAALGRAYDADQLHRDRTHTPEFRGEMTAVGGSLARTTLQPLAVR